MLCKFLLICKELCFKSSVLFFGLASRACACKRECVENAVFKLNQCLRRGTCNLYVRSRKIDM